MPDVSCSILHAADFRLDVPLHGVREVPETFRSWMIDAPYLAAERVFDAAIQERVALVVLAGSMLDLTAPHPRAIGFLIQQFQRLAQHGIPVCWAGGERDRASDWPPSLRLPESIHHFGGTMAERISPGSRSALPLTVVGRGGGDDEDIPVADFVAAADGSFSIALACGRVEAHRLVTHPIDYWALGGRPDRKTLCSEPRTVHYPGTPQGRCPSDLGPHGCTIVEVPANRQLRLRFVPCDVVRWQHERVLVAASASWDELSAKLAERLQDLRSQTPDCPLLVRWTLVGTEGGEAAGALRELGQRAEKWLRKQSAGQSEPCWPIAVGVEAADRITPASYREDTLLGDYLRAIRAMQEDPSSTGDLAGERGSLVPAARWVAEVSDPEARRQVLQEAAELGAALLRGERMS